MSDAPETACDLPEDTDALKAIVGNLEETVNVQKLEIERLQEQLRLALHKRFGPSSEKTPDNGSGTETEITVPGASKSHPPSRRPHTLSRCRRSALP